MNTGIIFNIKKFAIHDGPGIRTTVFLKGCPLRCQWCHNPESWLRKPEISLDQEKCIRCYQCVSLCPEQAIFLKDDYPYTDQKKCALCSTCVSICPAQARGIIGRRISTVKVIRELRKDLIFYQESDGGVTFSGGEPLEQIDFLAELLLLCKEESIHIAVDTCGYAPWSNLERILSLVDLWLFDLKILDEQKHKHYTGVSNQLILENLRRLSKKTKKIEIRIPLIPGVNDNIEEMAEMAGLIRSLSLSEVNILPFHRLGLEKYRRLGLSANMEEIGALSQKDIEVVKQLFSKHKLRVNIGG
ncbi:MAG: glycyl-radical enzyme activating protein [Candidatus Atribacteria bacterium]|nr:glycyl-radical enzyme activating protein [Candidatus Atribacteria bacterium]